MQYSRGRGYEGARVRDFSHPRTFAPLTPKNIDQHPTANTHFNTENAIFEKFSPEVLNFAKKKGFS
jgi:hypothetical protein